MMRLSVLVSTLISVSLTTAACNKADCPAIACQDGFSLEILDTNAGDLPEGIYQIDVELAPPDIPSFHAECTVPRVEAGNLCNGIPTIVDTYAHLIGDMDRSVGLFLVVTPPLDAEEGTKTITVELTTPDGASVSRDFEVAFELEQPGGPPCEACWSAVGQTWTLPLAE